ncbi:MAG: TrmH family RNA methyltransferase, partial [Brevundimonas sp.]|uniref:TrmH family RNA methyltransferase n=1 Tax=Brevundimonas sp. TaxID=1871086 RepID=UPI0040335972
MADRLITSLTNDTVKNVRALNMRKERESTGQFLAEGLKFIGEALDQGRAPKLLLVGMEAREHPLLDRAKAATRAAGGEVIVVTHPILEKISRRDNPQTVLGVFEQVYTPLSAIQPGSSPCWVALEQVRDPGNLGTIIRTADAAGCGGCAWSSRPRSGRAIWLWNWTSVW